MAKLKKMFGNVAAVAIVVLGITFAGGCIYGCYWLAKTGSYSFFYEDMVIKTIHQQVQPQYLKRG